jgi:hypothetical protein
METKMENEKRLIDANALSEKIGNMKNEITYNRGGYRYCNEDEKNEWDKLDGFDSLVCDAPTVDAVEVVHGRWEWYTDRCEDLFLGCDDDYGWRCSKCKVPLDDEDDPEVMPTFRYCPNCGAKMDGDIT